MMNVMEIEGMKLAIEGGEPAVAAGNERPPRWGEAERARLDAMLDQTSLFYWNGPQTQALVEKFREFYPLEHVMPCSSGTAAIHIAVAAAGIGPGDEVIVPPITDMGTLIGVLYQQGVPVFADVRPHSYNLDPADVARKITKRTKAIIAVHLTGNPCEMDALRALADEHGLVLIEDCAQAWGATYRGRPVGTTGDIACYSFNDFKHVSCGDGGVVGSNNARFGPLLQTFGDKAYDRSGGRRFPQYLAPNYRISEPQSAVAAAQMERMWELTGKRAAAGRLLNGLLEGIPGVDPQEVNEADRWTSWFMMIRIEPEVLNCDIRQFATALTAEGVPCGAGYIQVPLYKYPVFQEASFFAGRWPVKELGLTEMDYRQVRCPVAEEILETCIQLVVHEGATETWVRQVAEAVAKVARHFAR